MNLIPWATVHKGPQWGPLLGFLVNRQCNHTWKISPCTAGGIILRPIQSSPLLDLRSRGFWSLILHGPYLISQSWANHPPPPPPPKKIKIAPISWYWFPPKWTQQGSSPEELELWLNPQPPSCNNEHLPPMLQVVGYTFGRIFLFYLNNI